MAIDDKKFNTSFISEFVEILLSAFRYKDSELKTVTIVTYYGNMA